jgi:Protein of unknown function (DUF3467)
MAFRVQLHAVMQRPAQSEEDKPEGRYSNIFWIGYNAYEFIVDFGQCHPPDQEHMHTRIVTSPSSARGFSELLQNSLAEHGRKYSSKWPEK